MIFRDEEGRFYHTGIKKGEINPYILTAGSPGRVRRVARNLKEPIVISKQDEERGILAINGFYNEVPVTVVNTGMGTPSASIVIREIIESIDFEEKNRVTIIRIGTCGSLQKYVKVGDMVVSTGCVRDDGTTRFIIHDQYPAVPDLKTTISILLAAKDVGYTVRENLWVGITHAKSELYGFETPPLSAVPKELESRLKSYKRMGVLATEMEFPIFTILADMYNAEWREKGRPRRVDVGCVLLVVSPAKEEAEHIQFKKPSQRGLIQVGLKALENKNRLDEGKLEDLKGLLYIL